MIDFAKVALDLVPVGSRPSLVELREEIAETLQRVVSHEIETHRRESLPAEIVQISGDVKRSKSEVERWKAALEQERFEFKKVVAGHLEFLSAVENWIEWIEGNGGHDDREALWANVKESWDKFRRLKAAD